MPTMMFVGNLGFVFVAVIGGLLVTRQAIAIGDVQAFIQYARQFSMPIMQLSGIANMIQLTIVAAERVFELLDEPEETPDAADATVIAQPRGAVQFDAVHFRYKDDVPLIDDLSLDVEPGQTIAIVGPTGAGKTTLVNLLMRFYDVADGAIRVDGVDIRQVKRGPLRRTFGMVLQDTWLFSGTIRENIGYGREHASDESIVEAAKAAQADHFIRTLPENYETAINEEASNLSQGQKQLLTIARAFLADPAILILDEATSSVDTRTEVLIQESMHRLMRGRTTFVIAHRLSTIRNAGPDPDDRGRPDRRARLASRTARREGALRRALREPVRRTRGSVGRVGLVGAGRATSQRPATSRSRSPYPGPAMRAAVTTRYEARRCGGPGGNDTERRRQRGARPRRASSVCFGGPDTASERPLLIRLLSGFRPRRLDSGRRSRRHR
jgi:ABC-type cobalamin/Fe3+-siderophores transport system ATPase subunit